MASWNRVSGLLAVAGTLVGGCGPGGIDGGSCELDFEPIGPAVTPQLVANEMTDTRTIRLSFTQAMAPVDCVDPESFRISSGTGYVADVYASFYTDPAAVGEICAPTEELQECCYYSCGGAGGCEEVCIPTGPIVTRVVSVANDPNDDHSLLLTLNQDMGMLICSYAELNYDYPGITSGLFVHYSPGDIPSVQSQSGGELEAIAEHWVLTSDYYVLVMGANLPNMPIPLPFICP